MTEKPIPFKAPMVRAILNGTKTQTRRVITLPCKRITLIYGAVDIEGVKYYAPPSGKSQEGWADPGVNYWTYDKPDGHMIGNHIDPCPYGQVGDQLWVRETARIVETSDNIGIAGNAVDNAASVEVQLRYEADRQISGWLPYPSRLSYVEVGNCIANGCYKEAARIHLEITNVRVERLNEISWDDAIAEGWQSKDESRKPNDLDPKSWYRILWEQINGAGSWSDNPWVWVVEFKRINHGKT